MEALHPKLYLGVSNAWLKQSHGHEASLTHLKALFLGWWATWPHTVILPAVNCIGPVASLGYFQTILNSDLAVDREVMKLVCRTVLVLSSSTRMLCFA